MSDFQLGDRVTMTGTAYLRKDTGTYPEQWSEGELPKLNTYDNPKTYDTGIIVGKRTVMDGWTGGGYLDEAYYFQPKQGSAQEVYLVAFHLRRKPVMCFPHQLTKESRNA